MPGLIYLGKFVHSLALGQLEFIDGHLVVGQDGKIESFCSGPAPSRSSYELVHLGPHQFMIPGFIDTHTHAPQHSNLGVGLQMELLDWLETYTFPTESSFAKPEGLSADEHEAIVKEKYSKVVREYLKNGTTTCCYFGSIQVPANMALAKAAAESGQRAFIGKVCMDCNSPSFYCETTEKSLADTESFCKHVLDMNNDLVKPIITPRFAITCSRPLMKGLAEFARVNDLNIQTHLSENKNEISFTCELFPEAKHYTDVYEQAGLLTPKTVLAHSIYLSEEEQDLIKTRGSSISHCPNSNFSLSSGIMPLRKYLEKGLKVGLGTDVSGGYSPSILDAIRQALIASKALFFQDGSKQQLSVQELFHLATVGGAEALAIDDKVGNFKPGKAFDALLISPRRKSTGKLEVDFERFILTGDDRDISTIYVNGKECQC